MTASLENPFAGQGAVLLDIGGEVGALVVTMPANMAGVEVEIRPEAAHHTAHDHEHAPHPHVCVVNRPVEGTYVPSLVFPELVEGRYELYERGSQDVHLTVLVHGGKVAIADWPH